MGIFDWGKGKPSKSGQGAAKTGGQTSTQFANSQSSPASGSASSTSVRKDLLRVVLRESLTRNGIPLSWITADMLRTSNPKRESGLHVRLLVRHWDPRLMVYGVALEQDFYQRLLLLDPQAPNWLMGFSWQFALENLTACPQLPHPGSWTAPPPSSMQHANQRETRPADIIEGPVMIPKTQEDVRADLERLLAQRDDDVKRHGDDFAPTRPVQL